MKAYIDTIDNIIINIQNGIKNKIFSNEKKYQCEIKELKNNKTDEQRARYWIMHRKYAKLVGRGQTEIHNRQLCELGILQQDSYGTYIKEMQNIDYDYLRNYMSHLKPTDTIIETRSGKKLRVYYRLKPSEDFTTEENSRLIDILISNIIQDECDDKIDINYMKDNMKKDN